MENAQLSAPSWHRNVSSRIGAGVCASIAAHFGWNVVLVRVAFVASLAVTGGLACWVYLTFWAVTPFNIGTWSFAQKLLGAFGRFFTTQSPPPASSPSVSNVVSVE